MYLSILYLSVAVFRIKLLFKILAMRFSSPCISCGKQTEWFNRESLTFYCDLNCVLIDSTRSIRRVHRSIKCPHTGDQRCHVFGLNAAKVIFNHYGVLGECIEDEKTLEALIVALNGRENIYCCSAKQNVKDKKTEEAFLDVFIYKKRSFDTLDKEGVRMYDTMRKVLEGVATRSSVIQTILEDFKTLAEGTL